MTTKTAEKISEDDVREFLKRHPDFLKKNLDAVAGELSPPERNLGNGIIDFQHYMVKSLQQDSKAMRSKYDLLVDFCRDNMSVQAQVHSAALKLIQARNLEQLLEVVTQDLVTLFDVDVVRLAMESELAGKQDTFWNEENYSGIVYIDPGLVDITLGKKKAALLVSDCEAAPPAGFEQIFTECEGIVQSCALLRLKLDLVERHVILAFGVRYKDRFHAGQGIELLNFLAQIVAHQLDLYLHDLTI